MHPKPSLLLCFERPHVKVRPTCADTHPGAEWLLGNRCVFCAEASCAGQSGQQEWGTHTAGLRQWGAGSAAWKMQHRGTGQNLWAALGNRISCWVSKGDHLFPRSVSCLWRDWTSPGRCWHSTGKHLQLAAPWLLGWAYFFLGLGFPWLDRSWSVLYLIELQSGACHKNPTWGSQHSASSGQLLLETHSLVHSEPKNEPEP